MVRARRGCDSHQELGEHRHEVGLVGATIDVAEEDIKLAYSKHTAWWLDPEFTPIACAARRLGIAKTARVSYDSAIFDGKSVPMSPEMRAYTLAFGHSLHGAVPSRIHEARKALRKTSSDHKTEVTRDRVWPRVTPATFPTAVE